MVKAEAITPDTFAGKSASEIGDLLVWQCPKELPLSDFFDVMGGGDDSPEETAIVINEDVSRVERIGAGMTADKIIINGSD